MKTTPDYDLAPYLNRGRQLRSQAFLDAARWVARKMRALAASAPKRPTAARHA